MSDEMTTTGSVSFALRTPGPAFYRYTGDGDYFAVCEECPDWSAYATSKNHAIAQARMHNVAEHGG